MGASLPQIVIAAKACHEANRVYCDSIGDHSQVTWDEAPEWQRLSAIQGVEFLIAHPNAPASAQHESWVAAKVAEGWHFGPVKDPARREHPAMVPYDQLPDFQKVKDAMFQAVARAIVL